MKEIDAITYKIGYRIAERYEDIVKEATPKWWQWCVKQGGVFKWTASKLIKVIIIKIN